MTTDRSPMVSAENGWTETPPSMEARGYYWLLTTDFPQDPTVVHWWNGVVRPIGSAHPVPFSDLFDCKWNGPIPTPGVPA